MPIEPTRTPLPPPSEKNIDLETGHHGRTDTQGVAEPASPQSDQGDALQSRPQSPSADLPIDLLEELSSDSPRGLLQSNREPSLPNSPGGAVKEPRSRNEGRLGRRSRDFTAIDIPSAPQAHDLDSPSSADRLSMGRDEGEPASLQSLGRELFDACERALPAVLPAALKNRGSAPQNYDDFYQQGIQLYDRLDQLAAEPGAQERLGAERLGQIQDKVGEVVQTLEIFQRSCDLLAQDGLRSRWGRFEDAHRLAEDMRKFRDRQE